MYKEIIITIVVVILIIVLNVISENYTEDTAKIMQNYLDEVRVDLEENEEMKDIKEKVEKTITEWNKRKNVLAYYLEHDEIEKIETELTALNANIVTNEYNMGRENLEECYFLLEHVKEKEIMKLSNVF